MLQPLARRFSTVASTSRSFRLAVIGSGPAGFYTSHRLLRECPEAGVDMFDSLPVPHGLVRFGVAPDHPEVKNVMTTFDKVAQDPRFRFLGNVRIGKAISVDELRQHYDALLFAYGASEDRRLSIPNESAWGVESARAFVGWYNGLPDHRDLALPLDQTDTAVVIGQGNVALDVARVLLSPIDVLRKTDITEYALEALSKSRIRHVHVVGRRGPLQAAFTAKELREQMNLPGVVFHADRDFIHKEVTNAQDFVAQRRPLKRLMQILGKGSSTTQGDRSWTLSFLRSPTEILTADGSDSSPVQGIQYELNRLEGPPEQRRAIGTGVFETTACGLVLRSIGYRSVPLKGVPFDDRQGRVPNQYGKIMMDDVAMPGMYTAGWLKRGPTGVIVSTMADAYETADTILDDLKQGRPMLDNSHQGADGLAHLFQQHNVRPVSYDDWKRIEAAEFAEGAKQGKPREKMTSIPEMLSLLT